MEQNREPKGPVGIWGPLYFLLLYYEPKTALKSSLFKTNQVIKKNGIVSWVPIFLTSIS